MTADLLLALPGEVPAASWSAATEATPGPVVPELRDDLDPDDVTPGLTGFLVIFAAVLACIPLFLSMTGKLRGVRHRAEREEALEAQAALAAGRGEAVEPGAPRAAAPAPDDVPPADGPARP